MTDLLRPDDLRKISKDAEAMEAQDQLQRLKQQEEESKKIRDAFLDREVHSEAKDRINNAVRRAAAEGRHELQVFTFPASFCSDHGRRINNNDPDWPTSLEGFAKKAFSSEKRRVGKECVSTVRTR